MLTANHQPWLDGVEKGIRHLYNLGLVHNDLNPANIMFDGAYRPVVIDFNACSPEGYDLRMIGRTYEWYNENTRYAHPDDDLAAIHEIQAWLSGRVEEFKFVF